MNIARGGFWSRLVSFGGRPVVVDQHPPVPPPPPPPCTHDRFEVRNSNRIGCGTCTDCHSEVLLDRLFERLRQRQVEQLVYYGQARRRMEFAAQQAERLLQRLEAAAS